MEKAEIEKRLVAAGYVLRHETSKVALYKRGPSEIYIKQAGTDHPLVVHGKYGPKVGDLAAIGGVVRKKATSTPYHNIHMSCFDLRQNRGRTPTRYGYDFGFESQAGLSAFLKSI